MARVAVPSSEAEAVERDLLAAVHELLEEMRPQDVETILRVFHAGLTGGLGCLLAGLGGLAGLGIGVCLGLTPVALARSGSW